jgi:histidyl-tRNA synthetase
LSDTAADVLVTVWDEDASGESFKLAAELRRENLRVLVYPEADKLGKQFKYAGQINVPFVCVLGESELAENKVTLKNMETGEQETIEREEASKRVKIHQQNSQSKK